MGSNSAPLVADLALSCNKRDFMTSLSEDKQAEVILAIPILTVWSIKFTYQNFSEMKLILPIPKPRFCIYI